MPVTPLISVIVCSNRPDKFRRLAERLSCLLPKNSYELIGMHDAVLSIAQRYNRGVQQSRGRYLVFCHDDLIILSPDFHKILLKALSQYDVVGVAGAGAVGEGAWVAVGEPHLHGLVVYYAHPPSDSEQTKFVVNLFGGVAPLTPGIQVLDGLFIAARREVVAAVPFDEARFDGLHMYDMDFSLAAHLAGFRLAVTREILMVHESSGNFGEAWQEQHRRFLDKYRGRVPFLPAGRQGGHVVLVEGQEELLAFASPKGRHRLRELLAASKYKEIGDRVTPRLQTSLAAFNQGDLVTAAADCREALAMDPLSLNAWTLYGMILRHTGRQQEAFAAYQKAIAINPDFADVHYNLGNLLRDMGRNEEAVASYQRAQNLEPDNG